MLREHGWCERHRWYGGDGRGTGGPSGAAPRRTLCLLGWRPSTGSRAYSLRRVAQGSRRAGYGVSVGELVGAPWLMLAMKRRSTARHACACLAAAAAARSRLTRSRRSVSRHTSPRPSSSSSALRAAARRRWRRAGTGVGDAYVGSKDRSDRTAPISLSRPISQQRGREQRGSRGAGGLASEW